ncbi:MAG: branched-chain amino acid ABC transporter permease [Candidatus Symbiobacter sp.]|nr:branched-chain amino acid ABC transporter permease [Candidatus Symbiobacter sp.]
MALPPVNSSHASPLRPPLLHPGLWLLAALLLLLPWALPNNFLLDVAIRVMLNGFIVLGLNLLMGYTGQISLGHAGFVGMGAYGSAILTSRYGVNAGLGLIIMAGATGMMAYILARPILRLRGHALAMASLGLGIIISIILTNETGMTGGPDGMAVPTAHILGHKLTGGLLWYYLVAGLLLVAVAGALNLLHSPFGRALQAIHGSEIAARAAGINVAREKSRVFVLSAVMASIAGSLNAHYLGFITPSLAGFFHSIEFVTMVVVGGMASVFGSLVGAAILTLLPQLLTGFEGFETMVFGLILMGFMIFLPRGLVPSLAELWQRHPLRRHHRGRK